MAKDPTVLFESNSLVIREPEWFTPNTYDPNFAFPADEPGVYFVAAYKIRWQKVKLIGIVYVGSAKNLRIRYQRHEVLRHMREIYDYVRFYFQPENNYRKREIEMIHAIHPRFNIQHNNG